MTDTSRRRFLAAGGAGVAGAVTIGGAAAAAAASETADSPSAAREQVVAIVPDHRLAEVRLLVGEREVVVQDRDLARRILNAAGGR
jgi:hypothetical protein